MFGRFVRTAVAFLKKEDGPTTKYAVMLALILVAIFAAVATSGARRATCTTTYPFKGKATVIPRRAG